MRCVVFPAEKILGTLVPPPDKSITHRAIFLSALSCKKSVIRNPLLSSDCLSTIHCLRKLGVPIKISKETVKIPAGKKSPWSNFRMLHKPNSDLDCGNSGTTMRMLCGVLAAQPFECRLVGDSSLSQRPMQRVTEPLSQMGAKIQARKNNFAPLIIHGNPFLKPIIYRTPVASAQVKSAILLAGLFCKGKTTVEEPVRSRDHTERMLQELGIPVLLSSPRREEDGSKGSNKVSVWGGGSLVGLNLTIPGDFSSASFFIAAALLIPNSELLIKNVNLNPTRTGLLKVLRRMGAKIKIENLKKIYGEPAGNLRVQSSVLKSVSVSGKEIPSLIDEVPILSVLLTQSKGKSKISGVEELRVKESDRIAAICSQLKKMGAKIKETRDGMRIEGPTPLRGAKVNSFGDHRIAMSLAIAGLIAQGKTEIAGFDSVRISYPNFLTDLKKLIE